MRKFKKWVPYLLLLIFLGLLAFFASAYLKKYPVLDARNLDLFIAGFGPWALVVFFLFYLIFSPVPFASTILAATGGLLFGVVKGASFSIVAGTITSLVPFMVARKLGRSWVEKRLENSKVAGIIRKFDRGSGFNLVLFMRLVGILPWELQNYISGVTAITIPSYFLATVLGCTPMTFCLAFLGFAFRHPRSWLLPVAIAVTLVAFLIPVGIAWRITSRKEVAKEPPELLEE